MKCTFIPSLLLILMRIVSSSAARVSCYYSSWAAYRPGVGSYDVQDFPAELCTHAIYAVIGVNSESWGVEIQDDWLAISNGGFQRFIALKTRNPQLKVMVTMGGWYEYGQKYSELVADRAKRVAFTASIMNFLKRWKFDGLDIDWEYPGDDDSGGSEEDISNLVMFVQELRQAFDTEGLGWELTIAAPIIKERIDQGYNITGICRYVHAVHLNAFELRDYRDNFTDVHSPLYRRSFDEGVYLQRNVNDGAKLWTTSGCAPEKLVIGIPLYGRSFKISDTTTDHELHSACEGPGYSGLYTGESGLLAYYEICDSIQTFNWTERWDDVGMVPFAVSDITWVGYENPRSVEIKAQWILQQGYGGAMVRSTDMDDFRGTCSEKYPLLQILHNNLVLNQDRS